MRVHGAMSGSGLSYWVPLLARYTTGQIVIQIINLITGFLILRFLSIDEYAIYILASMLQTIGSVGSDIGISQGVVSIGAPVRKDKAALGMLAQSAMQLRRKLFMLVLPIVLLVAYFVVYGNEKRMGVVITVTILALVIAWVQQSVTIATSILNSHHDAAGLTRTGIGTATSRLLLVSVICYLVPYAIAALLVNLAGALIQARLLWRQCGQYIVITPSGFTGRDFTMELINFIKPLLPGVIYYLLQGQISTFLLGLYGATRAIAEVGALGRLGQVIGIVMLVNGFFIQPYFARITDHGLYALRTLQLVLLIIIGSGLVTASSILTPGIWLAILGENYSGLASELVIALTGAQLSVVGGILYTVVIATRRTQGQWLQIPLGLGIQIVYLMFVKIAGSQEALILNLLPAATYVVLQCSLLAHVILSWKQHAKTA